MASLTLLNRALSFIVAMYCLSRESISLGLLTPQSSKAAKSAIRQSTGHISSAFIILLTELITLVSRVQRRFYRLASALSGGWPRLLISLASSTQWGAPSFALLAKGGYDERIRNGFRAERTKVASAASLPALSTSSGQALAKNARTGHPRAQPPAAIRHISDPQIPLTGLKKME